MCKKVKNQFLKDWVVATAATFIFGYLSVSFVTWDITINDAPSVRFFFIIALILSAWIVRED